MMRREGFELTVGQPQVLTREIDGRSTSRSSGWRSTFPRTTSASSPSSSRCARAGSSRWSTTAPAGCAWSTSCPARGLIGFRTEFLTETRGTGLLHHVFDRWEPWAGELRMRPTGALVADRSGVAAQFALMNLQERGIAVRRARRRGLRGHDRRRERALGRPRRQRVASEKHLTNIRSSTADVLVRLVPHRQLSLDQALELLRSDECAEVTPEAVRLRKVVLDKRRADEAGAARARS